MRLGRFLVYLIGVLATLGTSCTTADSSDEPTLVVDQGWQRRWGDSPLNDAGVPVWVYGAEESEWEDIPITIDAANPTEPTYLWLRIKLPEGEWRTPAIHFSSIFTATEVYLGRERLAVLGRMEAVRDREYLSTHWNVVALPSEAPGQRLYLRILSFDHLLAGVSANRLWFGDYDTLVRRAVHHQLDQFVVGACLVLVGFFCLALAFKRRDPLYGSFGLFVTAAGGFLVLINTASRYFLDFLPLRVYFGFAACLLIPLGLFLYYENITSDYQRIAGRIWKFHAGFVAVAFLADIVQFVPLQFAQAILLGILPLELMLLLVLSVKSARRGDQNAKIFNFGFAVLGLSGLHDLFVSFRWLPDWRHLLGWGVLFFVATLGYLVERRFNRNLVALGQANLTLEHRVAERTRDLNEKNNELEKTLGQLRAAQQQLVMQEKMASLGNLVAGVAHEINTPVGAVASSADTNARSLAKIEKILKDSTDTPLREDKRFRTAVQILCDNQSVIETASKRINTIVRSLRNFARLDNSELMDVDIHDGLDSTLALVQHKLKGRIEVIKDYGELPKIRCFPSRLNQVFMNLLVNAAQAIEGKGSITITTRAERDEVSIRIEDTGRGIASDQLDRIFDPGFTTKGVGVGTGLGLSISYKIVQEHHGRIEVESRPGEYSRFTVNLPIRAT